LKEYEMDPSANKLVSGKAENALQFRGVILFQLRTSPSDDRFEAKHSHVRSFPLSPRPADHPSLHDRTPVDVEITDDDLLHPSLHLSGHILW
jgi:hypothetical protein